VIWVFEKLGWACDVRWPDEARLRGKRPATSTRSLGGMTIRGKAARADKTDKAGKTENTTDKAAA